MYILLLAVNTSRAQKALPMKKHINTILKIAVVLIFVLSFLNVRMRILIIPCKYFDYSFAAWSNEILIILF